MLIGPIFTREVVIGARRPRLYLARGVYCAGLLFLICTSWLLLTGTQMVRDMGDLARFGTILFQILAPLQLALAAFFSALSAASAVAQEKDRGTLVLLLMTHLSNSELVLGKLLASLLQMLVMWLASLPVFMLASLFGGISPAQIGAVFVVTLATIVVCGSLGSTVALWREKTYQALAITVLVLVLWLGVWEVVAAGYVGSQWWGISARAVAAAMSPWQAVIEAGRPYPSDALAWGGISSTVLFVVASALLTAVLNVIAILRVRVWHPSQEAQAFARLDQRAGSQAIGTAAPSGETAEDGVAAPASSSSSDSEGPSAWASAIGRRTRHVWDNPILWREVRTWAYGRKVLLVRLVYFALFGLVAWGVSGMAAAGTLSALSTGSAALAALFVLSLVLVNAQAVTSLTSERDGRTLDLLLVTDLTPKEFIYGKLAGTFYNSKEIIVLPLLLCGYLWYSGTLMFEHLVYLLVGLGVMYFFVAMLGIHAGITYSNSRGAIATSLGTVFFLFLGVATCMRMMLAFSGRFEAQLPFLGLMVFGGAGLYLALGVRNPSTAIGVASFACPLVTFYAITSFFLQQPHLVFVAIVAAYGFATAAMLIPAIDEFDVATGRTTLGE